MADESSSCEIFGPALARRSAKHKERIDTQKERVEKEQVQAFLDKLKEHAKAASKHGRFECEVSFPSTHKQAIDSELRKRALLSKWDQYDGDSYVVVSWYPKYN